MSNLEQRLMESNGQEEYDKIQKQITERSKKPNYFTTMTQDIVNLSFANHKQQQSNNKTSTNEDTEFGSTDICYPFLTQMNTINSNINFLKDSLNERIFNSQQNEKSKVLKATTSVHKNPAKKSYESRNMKKSLKPIWSDEDSTDEEESLNTNVDVSSSNQNSTMTLKQSRDNIYETIIDSNHISEIVNKFRSKFETMERRQNASKNPVSTELVFPSTQLPISLILNYPQPSENMINFVKVFGTEKYNLDNITTDKNNLSVAFTPLNTLVDKNDRSFIIEMSELKTQSEEPSDPNNYTIKVGLVRNVQAKGNEILRSIILQTLFPVFDNDTNSDIQTLLNAKSQSTHCIFIYDGLISLFESDVGEVMIGLILFSSHPRYGSTLDYIYVKKKYRHEAMGSWLVHFSRVFVTEHQKGKNIPMYLTSRDIYLRFYRGLNFFCVPKSSLEDREKGMFDLKNRFTMNHDNEDGASLLVSDDLHLMKSITMCPRYINRIPYHLSYAEDYIFADTNERRLPKKHKKLKDITPDDLINKFDMEVSKDKDLFMYSPVSEAYKAIWDNSKNMSEFVIKVYSQIDSYISIGSYYTQAYHNWIKGKQRPSRSDVPTTLFQASLINLEIGLLPCSACVRCRSEDILEIWIKIRCSACKKQCWVRKPSHTKLNTYLSKIVMSIWMTHCFALDIDPGNTWYKQNNNWNICKKRTNKMFDRLKQAQSDDKKHFNEEQLKDSYTTHAIFFQNSMLNIYNIFQNRIDSILVKGIELGQKNSFKRKIDKDPFFKSYNKRSHQLLEDIGGTFIIKSPKPIKKIKENHTKKKQRHSAERKWREEHWDVDLKNQLKFHTIEYVVPDKRKRKVYCSVSKNYIDYYGSSNYKGKKKKDQDSDIDEDLSHFVAYFGRSESSVISQDYFVATNEFGKNPRRVISQYTVRKCFNYPNTKVKLTNIDKRQIKFHVNEIRGSSQINTIKRVHASKYDVEEVKFDGTFSESKFLYEGIDMNGKTYPLSNDWIELNFKEIDNKFYNNLLKLEKGKSLSVPYGSRNEKDSGTFPYSLKERGPEIKHVQSKEERDSCLFYSIASLLDYVGEIFVSKKIIEVYDKLKQDPMFIGNENILLQIFRNGYRNYGERRIKHHLARLTIFDTRQLIEHKDDEMYLILLTNKHVVCLYQSFVFDCCFKYALPRHVEAVRLSSELDSLEHLNGAIKKVYQIKRN